MEKIELELSERQMLVLRERTDMSYGSLVRSLRERCHLSQSAAAKAVGWSAQYQHDIESGRRTPGQDGVRKMADAFCATPEDRRALLLCSLRAHGFDEAADLIEGPKLPPQCCPGAVVEKWSLEGAYPSFTQYHCRGCGKWWPVGDEWRNDGDSRMVRDRS